jgi:hypothetical protein
LSGGDSFPEVAVAWRDFSDEADTIRKMINLASGDLALKEFTLGVIHADGAASRAELDQALAIGEWVQKQIYYVHEHGEVLQRPATTLRLRAGDCDDFTILICSMLGTVGIREKACIIRTGKGTGDSAVGPMHWSHIFAVALPVQDGKPHRLTLDATLEEDKYPIRSLTNPIALVKARGDRVEPLFV